MTQQDTSPLLIRPRFTEFHNVYIPQYELDFAIPFLNEDIPLFVDPFLLWKSPSFQDKGLHQMLVAGFNHLGVLAKQGREDEAISQIVLASECEEVGLGNSATRNGRRIGRDRAAEVVSLFNRIPYYRDHGFRHFEEIQLFIDDISKDRVSDIACSFMKSFLIDYTHQECANLEIPMQETEVPAVYNPQNKAFETIRTTVPIHPETGKPLLLVPKRWLRHVPWINYEAYFRDSCPQDDIAHEGEELTRVKVLTYNRENYGVVDAYVRERERTADSCAVDPLFTQIPVISARRKLNEIKRLPTGKEGGADIKYERAIGELLPTLLYPHLDFAQEQARTDSGVSIRDLIFYNSRSHEFLREIMSDYGSRQITFEMKNVAQISREHIDQLNRYLHESLGKFGVFVTRNSLKRPEQQRTIDLWSGQRKALIALTDTDLEQMVEVFDSKQRHPIDVMIRSYAQYRRLCP
ncbi:hypothetical protein [Methylocystis sp. SC2]|uniref:hypothetical protein n=1 Tax=Methylocystis sp. (strain SC2) TaxID=187303 RepID=UPI00027AF4FA|nr:hypothetical protein [Methylocystis sp. SC2]CCJ08454.1 Uncharacterized protein BN69_3003 [Methylocystis sp. SC2]